MTNDEIQQKIVADDKKSVLAIVKDGKTVMAQFADSDLVTRSDYKKNSSRASRQ